MMLDKFRIDGKVAIVTGAGGGLGRAIALGLIDVGSKVVVADFITKSGGETAQIILQSGGDCTFVQADLTIENQVRNLIEKSLEKFGRIDILINNAGIQMAKPALEIDEEQWHRVMNTNLTGAFLCSKYASEPMIKQGGGKIINISSTAGIVAATNQASYSASKAGLISLTKSLALEWARYNINVNAIAPGYLRTAFSAAALEDEKIASTLIKRIPLRRFGETEDIIPLVIYLASPASNYMTGETIIIDGGHLCHM